MKKTILIISKMGAGIRMSVADFPVTKRGGQGVRAMRLHAGDEVATAVLIDDENSTVE